MATPSERLPWLDDEPSGGSEKAAPKKAGGSLWPWYLLLLLLIAGVVAGAWWLSTGKEAAPPVLPAEESIPIPITQQEPATAQDSGEAAISNSAEPALQAPRAAEARTRVRRSARTAETPAEAPLTIAEEQVEGQLRGIFPADEPATAPPPADAAPKTASNPRPYRGRVVQLGAFPTKAQAEQNWKRITRRYPYLATKPKMVNTVDVRGLGGGRPTRMYRLQLGTSSQAQSVVICQQLERAGHSCVVVY